MHTKSLTNHYYSFVILVSFLFMGVFFSSCSRKRIQKEEQINIRNFSDSTIAADSALNSIQGNISMNQLSTRPNSVILTGLPEHRLVTVYKSKVKENSSRESYSYSSYESDYYGNGMGDEKHFIPGFEILYGYNLLNIAHYNLKTEKLNFLFKKPVLIKTLYYPSFTQDSIDKKPVTRNYYFVSVYDEDTDKDTLINKRDLRRFYYFDADCSEKIQLLPEDYSAIRSQYDSKTDVMYVFARFDKNKNGTGDKDEPIHIFWIDLKNPVQAKLLY